jgi:hypothetical protein
LIENTRTDLSALAHIAAARESESIGMVVATEKSRGFYIQEDIEQAYRELGISDWSSTEEDTVSTHFHSLWTESSSPDRRKALKQALQVIAKSQNSDLLAVTLSSIEEEKPPMDLTRASRILDFDATEVADEEIVLMLFQMKVRLPSSALF